jgi:hypothetical protein
MHNHLAVTIIFQERERPIKDWWAAEARYTHIACGKIKLKGQTACAAFWFSNKFQFAPALLAQHCVVLS